MHGLTKCVLLLVHLSSWQVASGKNENLLATGFMLPSQEARHIVNEFGKYLTNNKDAITSMVDQILTFGLESIPENVTSVTCTKHVELFVQALLSGEDWAVRMFDAMGKPGSAIKDFNYIWIGSFEECIAIEATQYVDPVKKTFPSHPYTAKYCTVAFPISYSSLTGAVAITIGTCFPESCSNSDVTGLVTTLLDQLPENMTKSVPKVVVTCHEKSMELSDKAVAVIVVGGCFIVLIAMATVYDLTILIINKRQKELDNIVKLSHGEDSGHVNVANSDNLSNISIEKVDKKVELNSYNLVQNGNVGHLDNGTRMSNQGHSTSQVYKPGKLGQFLLAFSMYTNALKILNTNQPGGTLTAVNGIRFLSMAWVILGHSIIFGFPVLENLVPYTGQALKRFTFQAIANGTFAVDTFFVLSGLLVSFLSFKELKKRGSAKKFNWFMFYCHRFWRLTPPYMLFMMIYSPTIKYWGNGPFWQENGLDEKECEESWWTNLLYINNLYKTDKKCVAWSWYLANDMQFYVVSPMLLIPLFYSPVIGSFVCLLLVVGSMVATGIISHHYGAGPNVIFNNENLLEIMEEMYTKPWCRVGPYVLGFWTGFVLYKTKCKPKLPKAVVFLGWTISTAVALVVLYGLYTKEGLPNLNIGVSALYNATSRPAWAMCVCWLVFACATGHGGAVNVLLSWKAIIPLSRLTYCAYLVHPVVLYMYFNTRKSLLYLDDMELIVMYLGLLVVSYGAAFILSLVFESPMMGMEKVLLGKKKHN